MSQHRDSARLMNQFYRLLWKETRLFDVGGGAFREIAVKRLLDAFDVSFLKQEPGEVGTTYDFVSGNLLDFVVVDVETEAAEFCGDLRVAPISRVSEHLELRCEGFGCGIDEVSEDVHRAWRVLGADFYSVHKLETFALRGELSFKQTVDRIVIGQRDCSCACLRGEPHHLGRRIAAVGERAVSMKIDEVVLHRARYYPLANGGVNFAACSHRDPRVASAILEALNPCRVLGFQSRIGGSDHINGSESLSCGE